MTDDEFLQKLSEDGWTETRNSADIEWVPQGEIYITSGKKLQWHDRKETND